MSTLKDALGKHYLSLAKTLGAARSRYGRRRGAAQGVGFVGLLVGDLLPDASSEERLSVGYSMIWCEGMECRRRRCLSTRNSGRMFAMSFRTNGTPSLITADDLRNRQASARLAIDFQRRVRLT